MAAPKTLPAELNDAQPTVNPTWTVEKVTEQLAEPKKLADGASITKRTSQIVYTAKAPLAHELRDALVLSMKLPDAADTTPYIPTRFCGLRYGGRHGAGCRGDQQRCGRAQLGRPGRRARRTGLGRRGLRTQRLEA